MEMRTFPVLAGAGAHDVYPAADGAVWFTAQSAGKLGRLDPRTGKSDLIALGVPLPTGRPSDPTLPARPETACDARGEVLSAAQGAAARQPQHGEFRSPGRPVAHRVKRRLWPMAASIRNQAR